MAESNGNSGTPKSGVARAKSPAATAAARNRAKAATAARANDANPVDVPATETEPVQQPDTNATEVSSNDVPEEASGSVDQELTEEVAAEKPLPSLEPQAVQEQVVVTAAPPAGSADLGVRSFEVSSSSDDPAFTGSMRTVISADAMPPAPKTAPTGALPTVPAGPSGVEVEAPSQESAPTDEAVVFAQTETPIASQLDLEAELANAETASSPRRQREEGPEPAAALTSDRLLTKVAAPPVDGWRKLLYTLTFGQINVGDSDKVRLERAQENLIASRLSGPTRYVPVLSRKGGVGKTTITTLLGMALADIREDRVIALDANPDRGTLSDRSPGSADFTARSLVRDRFNVNTFSQLADYVTRDGSRLDVLASDTDPAVAQAFDDADYRAVTDILGKYYSIVLTDSGTGMVHSVMKGTLEKANAVVLVSGGSVDEARLASETLSWLEAHGRHDLVANATVVINVSGGPTQVDLAQIEEHFSSRVRNVLRIPYDKHLAEGSRVELAKLRPATRAAVRELAALVVSELQRTS